MSVSDGVENGVGHLDVNLLGVVPMSARSQSPWHQTGSHLDKFSPDGGGT